MKLVTYSELLYLLIFNGVDKSQAMDLLNSAELGSNSIVSSEQTWQDILIISNVNRTWLQNEVKNSFPKTFNVLQKHMSGYSDESFFSSFFLSEFFVNSVSIKFSIDEANLAQSVCFYVFDQVKSLPIKDKVLAAIKSDQDALFFRSPSTGKNWNSFLRNLWKGIQNRKKTR